MIGRAPIESPSRNRMLFKPFRSGCHSLLGALVEIYFDSIQEGSWFKSLHPALRAATLKPFPAARNIGPALAGVLEYDRPDIVLVDKDVPILVVERTIEVPSGHNVGQRFARLVAAARRQVPVVYFGPYAAYKHGGSTQGPRYMNLRLFRSLAELARIEDTAVTPINWPVDSDYEIITTPEKDDRIKEYLKLFFDLYATHPLRAVSHRIRTSDFEREQEQERDRFIRTAVRNAEQYDGPPDSVVIGSWKEIPALSKTRDNITNGRQVVFYKVGMNYIRSDPYTGMAMLYSYLYCGGMSNRQRALILSFPNITVQTWKTAAGGGRARKDIRLFTLSADGILFSDGFLAQGDL